MRRLVLATAIATFVLIIVGGVVRVSDSGLGCGPGRLGLPRLAVLQRRRGAGDGPPLDRRVHAPRRCRRSWRFMIVSISCSGLAAAARVPASRGRRCSVLVLAQGGARRSDGRGATSRRRTSPRTWASRCCFSAGSSTCTATSAGRRPRDGGPRLRALSIAASVAVLCTVVAGGYMAGTQNYGRADYQLGDGAHHACGKEFPTCNGEFMPFGKARARGHPPDAPGVHVPRLAAGDRAGGRRRSGAGF